MAQLLALLHQAIVPCILNIAVITPRLVEDFIPLPERFQEIKTAVNQYYIFYGKG
jgi:hypothetical protein